MSADHGSLISTLTHERKHRLVKRYTVHRSNLRSWELGVIEELCMHTLYDVMKPGGFLKGGLHESSRPMPLTLRAVKEMWPGVPDDDISVSNHATGQDGVVTVGDVVLNSPTVTTPGHFQVAEREAR